FAFRYRTLEHNEGNHGFTCRGIRAPHDSSLRYQLMRDQGRFDLHGSQAVARHVQHVVDAAHDPDIAIFVALGTVPRKVIALGFRWEVALLESFGVAPDRPDHGWPGFLDHQGTALSGRYFLAILVNDAHLDAGQRQCAGARLQRRCAWQGSQYMSASL